MPCRHGHPRGFRGRGKGPAVTVDVLPNPQEAPHPAPERPPPCSLPGAGLAGGRPGALPASGAREKLVTWIRADSCNHKLSELLPMAVPAANLQQKLSYRLKHQPGAAVGVYRVGASGPLRPRLLRIAIIGFFIFARFAIIVPVAIIIGIIFIIIARRQNLQQIEMRASLPGCFDRRHEGVDHPAILSASPGVILPRASAAVTAFIARETSWADGPQVSPVRAPVDRWQTDLTVRSRHGGSTRSMLSRFAVGSPASAISTALRVNVPDSPASSAAAASVALLRETPSPATGVARSALFERPPAQPARWLW